MSSPGQQTAEGPVDWIQDHQICIMVSHNILVTDQLIISGRMLKIQSEQEVHPDVALQLGMKNKKQNESLKK